MKRNNKKGFTIVELIIVIAVIAVLAAVLIPTFSNLIKKANQSKDTQLVRNLNTALSMETSTGSHQLNIYEALKLAELNGMIIDYLSPSAEGYEYVYSDEESLFLLVDFSAGTPQVVYPEKKTVAQNKHYWRFASKAEDFANADYSWCLGRNYTDDTTTELTVSSGVADLKGNLQLITYAPATASADNLYFYTANPNCNIHVNNNLATVTHEGTANVVYVQNIAPNSYHSHANIVGSLIAEAGRIVFEADSHTNVLAVVDGANPDIQVKEGATFGLYGKVYESTTSDDADITVGSKKFNITNKDLLPTPSQGTVQGCNHKGEGTCDLCGQQITKPVETPEHTIGEWKVTQQPTCTADGSRSLCCAEEGCDYIYITEVLPKLGHDYTITIVESTCTVAGSETKDCSRCSDHTVTALQLKPHTEQTIPAVPATCTQTGLTEGAKCSVCGTVTTAQTVTEKIPHTEQVITGKPATCGATGLTDGKKCSVCGEILVAQEDVAKLDHSSVWKYVITDEPTCELTGQETLYCSMCNVLFKDDVKELSAVDHKDDNGDGLCDFDCGTNVEPEPSVYIVKADTYISGAKGFRYVIPKEYQGADGKVHQITENTTIKLEIPDTMYASWETGSGSGNNYIYTESFCQPGEVKGCAIEIIDQSGLGFNITSLTCTNDRLAEFMSKPVYTEDDIKYLPLMTESYHFTQYLEYLARNNIIDSSLSTVTDRAVAYAMAYEQGIISNANTYTQYLKNAFSVDSLDKISLQAMVSNSDDINSLSMWNASLKDAWGYSINGQVVNGLCGGNHITYGNSYITHMEPEIIRMMLKVLYGQTMIYTFNTNKYISNKIGDPTSDFYTLYYGNEWISEANASNKWDCRSLLDVISAPITDISSAFTSRTLEGYPAFTGTFRAWWHGFAATNANQFITFINGTEIILELNVQN